MVTTEAERFKIGMRAGAGATLAAGAISLLMLVLHLWPSDRPLSVMAARMVLNDRMGLDLSRSMLFLVAGGAQLIYGAFCGGMLALLSEPITIVAALGMGAIRWSTTQVIVAPALGWGDFGLFARPLISIYTLLPHLAFALVAAWLIRQDEPGRVPVERHLPPLRLVHARPRLRRPFTSGRDNRRR
jgi:hypothetical protein